MDERLMQTISHFEGVRAQNEFMAELIEAYDLAAADGDPGRMSRCLQLDPISDPKNLSLHYAGSLRSYREVGL